MSWGQGKTQGWDDRGQSKASDPDHLEESRGQALLLLLFLDQGWDRPTASMRVLGRAGWERALSVNPALYFRMDLIQKTKLPLPPTKALTCALGVRLHMAFWKRLPR